MSTFGDVVSNVELTVSIAVFGTIPHPAFLSPRNTCPELGLHVWLGGEEDQWGLNGSRHLSFSSERTSWGARENHTVALVGVPSGDQYSPFSTPLVERTRTPPLIRTSQPHP